MNYPSIRIEGSILSPDILEKLEEANGQRPADFGLETNAKVKDEIARAWADAQDYWRIYQRKLETLKEDSPATTETRNLWIVPLLGLLGYQLEYEAKSIELNNKLYPISHRITNRGNAAIQITGSRELAGLDRKPEKATLKMSAHAMMQEYLNLTEQLYGIVTNGKLLRLLRDSSRLVKLTYLEFDLDRIFSDGLFADFAVLYRLLHVTRLPALLENSADCLLEKYHQETVEQGSRIREGLRIAVTEALQTLGTGFLAHPDNHELRQQVASDEIRPEVYFNHLLRLIYRLLFLMVIEERGMIFPKGTPTKNCTIYLQHYSVQRLRRLSTTRGLQTARHYDAWLQLLATFHLFENTAGAAVLGTTALGGQLFSQASLGPLPGCTLSNATLFAALEKLCYFTHPQTGQRMPVNFGALATEEFGSVYESLLELHPVIDMEPTAYFGFLQAAGNERKTSGSYYTPASLVDCLLDSALDPLLDEAEKSATPEKSMMGLKVCDPACGSGHFLIAAAQRIARRLSRLRAGDEEPSPEMLHHTLREVIGHCIFGVDINPMSVELCKVGLWLEAVEPGKPLNFLDHHIKCGNSLLGATPAVIKDGIPDKAYEPITGDNKDAAKWMKKLNQKDRAGQTRFNFEADQPWERLGNLPAAVAELEQLDDDTPESLLTKEEQYRQIVESSGYDNARLLHDAWCAAFVWPKISTDYGTELTTEHLRKIEHNPHSVSSHLKEQIRTLAKQYSFFHWHLEFPAVFGAKGDGGFDCILGNPPWDKIQPEEEKFFSTLRPDIASASSAKIRKSLIESLSESDPATDKLWKEHKREIEGLCQFLRSSGILRFSVEGNLNCYRVFTELAAKLVAPRGKSGLVVQTGLATDESGKELFDYLLTSGRLDRFLDFENREGFFPDVDSRMRFCLVTLGGSASEHKYGQFGWLLHRLEELDEPSRLVNLCASDLLLFNPASRTCPVFTSERDLKVSKKVYENGQHVCLDSARRLGQIDFLGELFNMTRDSGHFVKQGEPSDKEILPLYEAKYFHQFDHRYATTLNGDVIDTAQAQKNNAEFFTVTSRAVTAEEVSRRLAKRGISSKWLCGFRDIASATNERTCIMAVFPISAVGNSINMVLGLDALDTACLYSNANSFLFDFCCRQKISGTHVNIWIFKQLPAVPLEKYEECCPWESANIKIRDWIIPRVLELTYTAWDLESFAKDCGFDGPPFSWDEDRRFQIRCELDAAFFHIYGIERDDVDYIMHTFPIIKRRDEAQFGNYRTKDTILDIFDALTDAQQTGQTFVSTLDPPPADPRCCHPPRDKS